MTFTTEAEFQIPGNNPGDGEALLCVRQWTVLVSLLGLLVYLIGMRRCVLS
jgi:hypothetical protein